MKLVAMGLCLALIGPGAAAGQPAVEPREMRFTGPSAVEELCACLLDLRRSASNLSAPRRERASRPSDGYYDGGRSL